MLALMSGSCNVLADLIVVSYAEAHSVMLHRWRVDRFNLIDWRIEPDLLSKQAELLLIHHLDAPINVD